MKDLRKDFNWNLEDEKIPEGHKKRFEARLHQRKRQTPWVKIAAVLIIALLSSIIIYQNSRFFMNDQQIAKEEQEIGLESISPELASLESYYEASIQLQIAELQESEKYQEIFDAYFLELHLLEQEYQSLKKKLMAVGAQQSIILSLIENLQLRLELIQDLEQRINELNQLENENYQSNNV
mgnify:CR=1 FL=1